jgi:hypothetical protein
VGTKDIGEDLNKVEKSEQLKRYRESLHNLILTDYLEFRWYVNGEHRLTARIATEGQGKRLTPDAVWNFKVGGYQVCDKWLKDRQGRTLSNDDLTHYQRIVVALSETRRSMAVIDKAIPGWPLD